VTEPREPWMEFGAVTIAVVVLAVVAAALVALWISPWTAAIGLVGFALVLIAAMVVLSNQRARPPAADAPHTTPIADQRHRILVVADTAAIGNGLIEELRGHAAGRPLSVFVTAPALESRLGRLTSDQSGYDNAARRLGEVLRVLREAGVDADGEVGPDDPLQAADDGLRRFPADEILFVTHRAGKTNWLEDGVAEVAGSRYDQPVEHIAVS
jgi:hypothetical protein